MSDALRQTIKSILIEELGKHGFDHSTKETKPSRISELVSIRTDQDLSKFISRILDMAKDSKIRADIVSGRRTFQLETGGVLQDDRKQHHSNQVGAMPGEMIHIDHGLVTEKEILSMPDYVTTINLGRAVTLTPLASDAIRRIGITIQRKTL
jgi:hypothetical protein|tara:strand:+ start:991 stop:1446 length:456 start_codon:yes stop_codon:yes gene_type:complete